MAMATWMASLTGRLLEESEDSDVGAVSRLSAYVERLRNAPDPASTLRAIVTHVCLC